MPWILCQQKITETRGVLQAHGRLAAFGVAGCGNSAGAPRGHEWPPGGKCQTASSGAAATTPGARWWGVESWDECIKIYNLSCLRYESMNCKVSRHLKLKNPIVVDGLKGLRSDRRHCSVPPEHLTIGIRVARRSWTSSSSRPRAEGRGRMGYWPALLLVTRTRSRITCSFDQFCRCIVVWWCLMSYSFICNWKGYQQ